MVTVPKKGLDTCKIILICMFQGHVLLCYCGRLAHFSKMILPLEKKFGPCFSKPIVQGLKEEYILTKIYYYVYKMFFKKLLQCWQYLLNLHWKFSTYRLFVCNWYGAVELLCMDIHTKRQCIDMLSMELTW